MCRRYIGANPELRFAPTPTPQQPRAVGTTRAFPGVSHASQPIPSETAPFAPRSPAATSENRPIKILRHTNCGSWVSMSAEQRSYVAKTYCMASNQTRPAVRHVREQVWSVRYQRTAVSATTRRTPTSSNAARFGLDSVRIDHRPDSGKSFSQKRDLLNSEIGCTSCGRNVSHALRIANRLAASFMKISGSLRLHFCHRRVMKMANNVHL